MQTCSMLVWANTEMCNLLRLLTVIYSMRKESESGVCVCVWGGGGGAEKEWVTFLPFLFTAVLLPKTAVLKDCQKSCFLGHLSICFFLILVKEETWTCPILYVVSRILWCSEPCSWRSRLHFIRFITNRFTTYHWGLLRMQDDSDNRNKTHIAMS